MGYEDMLGLVQIEPASAKKKASKKLDKLGCDHCALNKRKDLHKVIPKIKGKELFIFGMCPGPEENRERTPFVGKAGRFLWEELRKVRIKRKHVDVDNVVRCYTSDYDDGVQIMRNPNNDELKCCSFHTEKALQKSKAKIYLILGSVAAKQILGKEWRAGTKVLWSEKLNAKVYCLYHPSYFIRGNMQGKAIEEWRKSLADLASDLKSGETLSAHGYVKKQDYKGIFKGSAAKKEARLIKKTCRKYKIRVSVDLEDDIVDGVNVPLVIGTCIKKGRSRVFFCGKWDIKDGEATNFRPLPEVTKEIIAILEDKSIEKVMQHGSYDVNKIEKLFKCKIRSYTYDTEYACYLKDPNRHSFGLDQMGLEYEPQFGEYKTITLPEVLPKGFDLKAAGLLKATPTQVHDYISARGLLRLAQVPVKKLIFYNGADCDLTKRMEIRTKKDISQALLNVYVDAAFTLDEMTPNGPWFDYHQLKKLRKLYPPRLKKILKRLRKLSGKPDFNPSSHPQVVWFLAKKLHLLHAEKKVSDKGKVTYSCDTSKGVLEGLARKHEVPALIIEYRRIKKLISTYMDSFEECANKNGKRLRTKWNLTGTATGRMSSGGGRARKKGETKVVNLQNIVNDPLLQNLAVPDKRWKKLFEAIGRLVKTCLGSSKEIRKLEKLQAKAFSEKDKVKKDALKKELYAAIEKIKERIQKNKAFITLAKKLVKKYGNISVLLGFDQGQVEVRVAAQFSGDKNLIKDCIAGDIHSRVGHAITGWAVEKIQKDKKTRTVTKNVHFGILFGLARDGIYDYVIAKDPETTMTRAEVERGYDNYFRRYPKVKAMVNKLRAYAERTSEVVSMFGFRRKLNVHSDQKSEEEDVGSGSAYWGNQAINTPVQGSAHQLMLMAMAMLRRDPKKVQKKLLGVPGIEVHDFMGWWTKLKNLAKAYKAGKYLLEKAPLQVVKKDFPKIKWKVPLEVEGKVGLRYGDSVEAEGKSLEQMLLDMYFTTWSNEEKLKLELEKELAA